MAVSYKKLWKLLIDKDMKKKDLRIATGMTTTALTLVSVAIALMFVMAKYGNSGATNKEEMQGDDGYDE